jgi:hypothetical protein
MQRVPGDVSSAVKRQGCEAVHSFPSSAEIVNGGTILQLSHTPSWRDALLVMPKDNFTFVNML